MINVFISGIKPNNQSTNQPRERSDFPFTGLTKYYLSQISNLNMKHETRNAERGTRNTEHGTRNTEHETRNTEHGTRNTEPITHTLYIISNHEKMQK
jgi:hypothetical protein